MADELFDGGADVIFAAAGCANAEIAAVAKEHEKLVIGYESNQNYLERGYVITSLNIRWDDVVFEELCAAGHGASAGGVRELDIASEHICYPIDDNNRALIPAEAIRKIEAARQRLAARSADEGV
jgi:basic membrane protein A